MTTGANFYKKVLLESLAGLETPLEARIQGTSILAEHFVGQGVLGKLLGEERTAASLREAAAVALGQIGDPRSISILEKCAKQVTLQSLQIACREGRESIRQGGAVEYYLETANQRALSELDWAQAVRTARSRRLNPV